mgnify:CR=1 FL=1
MHYMKNLILTFIIILLNSCGVGSEVAKPSSAPIQKQEKIEHDVSIEADSDKTQQYLSGTMLQGAVLDMDYIPIEDATIYTSPATIEVKSGEDGEFELISDKFYDDISYIIYFTHNSYFNDQKTGYYPEIDSVNNLGIMMLAPKQVIDAYYKDIKIKLEDSGIELKDN